MADAPKTFGLRRSNRMKERRMTEPALLNVGALANASVTTAMNLKGPGDQTLLDLPQLPAELITKRSSSCEPSTELAIPDEGNIRPPMMRSSSAPDVLDRIPEAILSPVPGHNDLPDVDDQETISQVSSPPDVVDKIPETLSEDTPEDAAKPEEGPVELPKVDDLASTYDASSSSDNVPPSPSTVLTDLSVSTPPSFAYDPFSDLDSETPAISYERDETSDGVLLLKPTAEQWEDFPAVLSVARNLGARDDGCFKILIPDGATGPLPQRAERTDDANAFKPQHIKATNNFRIHTIGAKESFPATPFVANPREYQSPKTALQTLRTLFQKNNKRQLRKTRYRVDVPAWTSEQRLAAGVPEKSPIFPLRGDRLDKTKAIIPGIHTPYVYEAGPAFGATFQIHAEDYRLLSLNHLYLGRKIWIIVPSLDVDLAEEKLERKERCSQFMRHRAEFLFPAQLNRLGIPHRIIDQRPGETIVILQDAYHEGFSDGYTLAEAKNYADAGWSASCYQPCDASCSLPTAIPGDYMKIVDDEEDRIDLCAAYVNEARKRSREGDLLAEPQNEGLNSEPQEGSRPVKMSRLS